MNVWLRISKVKSRPELQLGVNFTLTNALLVPPLSFYFPTSSASTMSCYVYKESVDVLGEESIKII